MISSLTAAMWGYTGLVIGDDLSNKKSWPFAGQNLNNTRADSKSKITAENVSMLELKWEYITKGDVSATPTVDGDTVYIVDWGGWIHAVDATSGAPKWSRSLPEITGIPGVFSRTSPAITKDYLVLGLQRAGQVVMLDKLNGNLVWQTKVDDHNAALITQSPVVYNDKIYVGVSSNEEALAAFIPGYQCCTFRGSMLALDLGTGKILWKTYTVPEKSTNSTDKTSYSGNAVWGSTAAIDPKRNAVYFTTGNNYSIPETANTCITNAGSNEDEAKKCLDPKNYFDSIISADLNTGKVNWVFKALISDTWTVACLFEMPNCPENEGPDADFGQGPALYTAKINGKQTDLIGAGQKSGIYWALNRDSGQLVWSTEVGPGGVLGGLQWGSAVSDGRIYTALSNNEQKPYTLPDGSQANGGGFAALDGSTGAKIWQISDPVSPHSVNIAPVSVANDVMFGCSMDNTQGPMYALDAKTGKILWTFNSGASCNSGASIVGNMVYWGSGYSNFGLGTGNNKVFAFGLPEKK